MYTISEGKWAWPQKDFHLPPTWVLHQLNYALGVTSDLRIWLQIVVKVSVEYTIILPFQSFIWGSPLLHIPMIPSIHFIHILYKCVAGGGGGGEYHCGLVEAGLEQLTVFCSHCHHWPEWEQGDVVLCGGVRGVTSDEEVMWPTHTQRVTSPSSGWNCTSMAWSDERLAIWLSGRGWWGPNILHSTGTVVPTVATLARPDHNIENVLRPVPHLSHSVCRGHWQSHGKGSKDSGQLADIILGWKIASCYDNVKHWLRGI